MINLKNIERYEANIETGLTAEQVQKRIEENLPESMEITGDKGITLQDVQAGKNSLEEFVAFRRGNGTDCQR